MATKQKTAKLPAVKLVSKLSTSRMQWGDTVLYEKTREAVEEIGYAAETAKALSKEPAKHLDDRDDEVENALDFKRGLVKDIATVEQFLTEARKLVKDYDAIGKRMSKLPFIND